MRFAMSAQRPNQRTARVPLICDRLVIPDKPTAMLRAPRSELGAPRLGHAWGGMGWRGGWLVPPYGG